MSPARLVAFVLSSIVIAIVAYFYPETAPAALAKRGGIGGIFQKIVDPIGVTGGGGMFGGGSEDTGGSASAPAPAAATPASTPTALTPTPAPVPSKKPGLADGESTALTSSLGVSEDDQANVTKKKTTLGA